jgi:hypothetical protein
MRLEGRGASDANVSESCTYKEGVQCMSVAAMTVRNDGSERARSPRWSGGVKGSTRYCREKKPQNKESKQTKLRTAARKPVGREARR